MWSRHAGGGMRSRLLREIERAIAAQAEVRLQGRGAGPIPPQHGGAVRFEARIAGDAGAEADHVCLVPTHEVARDYIVTRTHKQRASVSHDTRTQAARIGQP